jgi:arylsulfatase A-like enzyme
MKPNTDRPNILIVVMDATRADHLSSYGYGRKTSPNVDQLASQGVLYEQAIAAANWTLASMASIFTGLHVVQHGTSFHHQYLEPRFVTMAQALQSHGYQTALFSAGGWVSETFGMNRGFDVFYNYVDGFEWMRRFSKKVTPIENVISKVRQVALAGELGKMTYEMERDVRTWLHRDVQADKPFFAVAHFGDPHWPWFHHPKYAWRNGNSPRMFAPDGNKYMAGELELGAKDFQTMTDYYDGEVRFLDSYLGRLFNWMRAGGYLDNTLLVVTADHGEHLGDHKQMGHKLSVYESLLHVPLILYHPKYFAGGQRVSEAVQTLELLPTFLDVAGIDQSAIPYPLKGRSLRPTSIRGNPWPFTISENLAPNLKRFERVSPNFDATPFKRDLRALRDTRNGFKLIWSSDGRHELYNLVRDPQETRDLAAAEPERVRSMIYQLDTWLASVDAAQLEQLEPEMEQVVAQRLQDLGYF